MDFYSNFSMDPKNNSGFTGSGDLVLQITLSGPFGIRIVHEFY